MDQSWLLNLTEIMSWTGCSEHNSPVLVIYVYHKHFLKMGRRRSIIVTFIEKQLVVLCFTDAMSGFEAMSRW